MIVNSGTSRLRKQPAVAQPRLIASHLVIMHTHHFKLLQQPWQGTAAAAAVNHHFKGLQKLAQ
jgi:hypothetical protein